MRSVDCPFTAAINQIKQLCLPDVVLECIDTQPCFGRLYKDHKNSVCTEDCAVHDLCRQTYNLAQLTVAQDTPKAAVKKSVAQAAVPGKTVRNKWTKLNSTKYMRTGYVSHGTRNDTLLRAFFDVFGNLQQLPSGWHTTNFTKKYRHMGRAVVSVSASYHALYLQPANPDVEDRPVCICRFWTNTVLRGMVDLVPEIANRLSCAVSPSATGFTAISAPQNIPKKLLKKLYPCTQRVYVTEIDGSVLLAQTIKNMFKI